MQTREKGSSPPVCFLTLSAITPIALVRAHLLRPLTMTTAFEDMARGTMAFCRNRMMDSSVRLVFSSLLSGGKGTMPLLV